MRIEELRLADYEEVYALWRRTEGIGLSGADSREAITRYLERNPGLSSVAREDGKIAGALLAGHDGRRGFLHHLAVLPEHRRKGVGRKLVDRSLHLLKEQGIDRCHVFIFCANGTGRAFWKTAGWNERADISLYSRDI